MNKFKRPIEFLLQIANLPDKKVFSEFAEAAAMLCTMGNTKKSPNFVSLESLGKTIIGEEKRRYFLPNFIFEEKVLPERQRFIIPEGVKKELLAAYNPDTIFPDTTIESFNIAKSMNDMDIIFEFGKIPIFTVDNFLYCLQELAIKQFPQNHNRGILTNGCGAANIFYVQLPERIVTIYLYSWNGVKWQLYAPDFGYMQYWFIGSRVFSPVENKI
jgi:hypothetical protein